MPFSAGEKIVFAHGRRFPCQLIHSSYPTGSLLMRRVRIDQNPDVNGIDRVALSRQGPETPPNTAAWFALVTRRHRASRQERLRVTDRTIGRQDPD